jgi:crotonobetainyl-CoA:carnitine CoA-transferase CaiB-like acyl-CoA transferase
MRGYRNHPSTVGLRAYAPTLTSCAGIEALVAYPGDAPVGAMTVALSDAIGAAHGLLLVLAGLCARRLNDTGSAIELSQFEACVLANGYNIVAEQLGTNALPLEPFDERVEPLTDAEGLATATTISPDLMVALQPPRLTDKITLASLPWRFEGELPKVTFAAPELGAHTTEELRTRLQLTEDEIERLRAGGALT